MPFIQLNNHSVHFMCSVGQLYDKLELTDSEIVTREGLINTHKLILAINSPYIKKLLMDNKWMTRFSFKEVEHHIMKLIVDMMYYGEAYVPDTDVSLFTETAKLLQISSLSFANPNGSGPFPKRNTSEDNHAASCSVNVLESNEKEFPFVASEKMCKEDITHERRDRSNNILENIQLQSTDSPETDERRILRKDHSTDRILNASVIAKDEVCTDEEDLLEELNPFTFVAVPSLPVNGEEGDDEPHTSPIDEMQFINPLAEYAHDCDTNYGDNFKQDREMVCESQIKIENEEVKDENEAKKGNSGSSNVSFNHKKVPSFNNTSKVFVGDNVLSHIEPINSEHDSSVLIDDCSVERTEDLKVKFESICEISEFDLKEENSLDSDLDIGDHEGVRPQLLIKEHKVVTSGEEESCLFGGSEDMKQGLIGLCTSKYKKMSKVALKIMKPFDTQDTSSGNSAFVRKLDALNSEEIREQNDTSDVAESLKSKECASQLNSEMNCKSKDDDSVAKRLSCNVPQPIFEEDNGHERLSHSDHSINPLSCLICRKCFRGSSELNRHIRTHSAVKPYSCKVCNAYFCFMSHLQIHMRIHAGEKAFSCHVCQSSFYRNASLKRHMQTHTGEKPVTCDVCQKSFALKQHLDRHMLTHTGEKPFSCEICRKSFARKQHLKSHMGTHTGEKPFSCEICKKSFSLKQNLKSHLRTHTGERAFSRHTYESFIDNSTLTSHMPTHTKEMQFPWNF